MNGGSGNRTGTKTFDEVSETPVRNISGTPVKVRVFLKSLYCGCPRGVVYACLAKSACGIEYTLQIYEVANQRLNGYYGLGLFVNTIGHLSCHQVSTSSQFNLRINSPSGRASQTP